MATGAQLHGAVPFSETALTRNELPGKTEDDVATSGVQVIKPRVILTRNQSQDNDRAMHTNKGDLVGFRTN